MIGHSLSKTSTKLMRNGLFILNRAKYSTGNTLTEKELIFEAKTVEEFDNQLKDSNLVIVDFHADWCPPCKLLDPQMKDAIVNYQKFKLVKVNVDEVPELAQKYQIASIPQVTAFFKSNPVLGFTGFQPKPAILEFFKNIEKETTKN